MRLFICIQKHRGHSWNNRNVEADSCGIAILYGTSTLQGSSTGEGLTQRSNPDKKRHGFSISRAILRLVAWTIKPGAK